MDQLAGTKLQDKNNKTRWLNKPAMKTYHLHINGIVQGVGFRPWPYRLAREQQLRGRIENGSDGVHIYFNADAAAAQNFSIPSSASSRRQHPDLRRN